MAIGLLLGILIEHLALGKEQQRLVQFSGNLPVSGAECFYGYLQALKPLSRREEQVALWTPQVWIAISPYCFLLRCKVCVLSWQPHGF